MKTYIIRLKENNFSCNLAEETMVSCNNLNINAKFFDGIRITDIKDLSRFNLKVNNNQKHITLGTIGCFLSHWSLWKKCSEDLESYLILEHDALVLKDPKIIDMDIKEVCHLDAFIPFTSNLPSDSEEHFLKYDQYVKIEKNGVSAYPINSFYPKDKLTKTIGTSSFMGTYGYILKPNGAKKLIEFCNQFGVMPSDRAISHRILYLQRTNSTYVRLNPFFKSLNIQRDYTTRT